MSLGAVLVAVQKNPINMVAASGVRAKPLICQDFLSLSFCGSRTGSEIFEEGANTENDKLTRLIRLATLW